MVGLCWFSVDVEVGLVFFCEFVSALLRLCLVLLLV